jgi:hypothetical protein
MIRANIANQRLDTVGTWDAELLRFVTQLAPDALA